MVVDRTVFEEVGPFVWIFQKLTLIIGGVFLPIDFFPVWMQGVARALPFAFTAYWPAVTMVKWSWGTFLHASVPALVALLAVLWCVVTGMRRGRMRTRYKVRAPGSVRRGKRAGRQVRR